MLVESPNAGNTTANELAALIRPAQACDAARMSDVERSASKRFAAVPEFSRLADADPKAVGDYERLIADGSVLVAEDSRGELVGFVAADVHLDAVHIAELSVSFAWQRQGVGRALFDSLVSLAKRDGRRRITLTTFKELPWNAPLYEWWGFVQIACPSGRLLEILRQEAPQGLAAQARVAITMSCLAPTVKTGMRRQGAVWQVRRRPDANCERIGGLCRKLRTR